MKTIVTGASGFAGSHLAEDLLRRKQCVIALVSHRSDPGNLSHMLPELRVERADLRDEPRLRQLLQEIQPDRLYHLAAFSSPSQSLQSPRETYEVNFQGTLNLLCAVRDLQLRCRVLYVSTSEVYGMEADRRMPLHEDCPFRPASPYAASKAAAELAAFQFFKSFDLDVVRVRPFHHTGPRQSAAFVCSSFARQLAEIEIGTRPPVVQVGNLAVQRDFSDVRDMVQGYQLALEQGKPGEVYQLCSGRPVSVEAILDLLIGMSSRPVQVVVDESRVRKCETPVVWGDPSKAREALGWEPHYDLRTTLRDLKRSWDQRLRNQPGTP